MKIASYGNYGLHTIQYPSQRWGYVGQVPEILCKEGKTNTGLSVMNSLVFNTEPEAIQYFEDHKHLIS